MVELEQEYVLDKNNKIKELKNVEYKKNILGSSYFEFIDDSMLIKILEKIFQKVREKRTSFHTTYRCDDEENIRTFSLDIIPTDNDNLKLIHKIIDKKPRIKPINLTKRSSDIVYLCAWCNRIKIQDAFVEIDDAVNKLKLLEHNYLPEFSHCICNECQTKLLKELDEMN